MKIFFYRKVGGRRGERMGKCGDYAVAFEVSSGLR